MFLGYNCGIMQNSLLIVGVFIALLFWGPSMAEQQQGHAHTTNNKASNSEQQVPPTHVIINPPLPTGGNKPESTAGPSDPQEKPLPRFVRPEWVIVYVTIVYAIIGFFTLRDIRRQANLAERAAKATETSAIAAMGVAIPTLMLHKFSFSFEPGCSAKQFYKSLAIKIEIKNFGQSPAFLKKYAVTFTCEDQLPKYPKYGRAYTFETEDVLDAGKVHGMTCRPESDEISDGDVRALVAKTKLLAVYGYVSYGDIFGSPIRYMKFCKRLLEFDDSLPDTLVTDDGGIEYTSQQESYHSPAPHYPKNPN
jgi:hypothetical protein